MILQIRNFEHIHDRDYGYRFTEVEHHSDDLIMDDDLIISKIIRNRKRLFLEFLFGTKLRNFGDNNTTFGDIFIKIINANKIL